MEDKKIRKSLKTHITVLTLTIFVIVFLPILAFFASLPIVGIIFALLVSAVGITWFVFWILGIVLAFKLGPKVVRILYIIGIFLSLLFVLIGSIIAVVKIKKARQTLEKTINTNAF